MHFKVIDGRPQLTETLHLLDDTTLHVGTVTAKNSIYNQGSYLSVQENGLKTVPTIPYYLSSTTLQEPYKLTDNYTNKGAIIVSAGSVLTPGTTFQLGQIFEAQSLPSYVGGEIDVIGGDQFNWQEAIINVDGVYPTIIPPVPSAGPNATPGGGAGALTADEIAALIASILANQFGINPLTGLGNPNCGNKNNSCCKKAPVPCIKIDSCGKKVITEPCCVDSCDCDKFKKEVKCQLAAQEKKITSQGKEIVEQGKEIVEQGKELDIQGKILAKQGKVIDAQGKELDAQGKELDAQAKAITEIEEKQDAQEKEIKEIEEKQDTQEKEIKEIKKKVCKEENQYKEDISLLAISVKKDRLYDKENDLVKYKSLIPIFNKQINDRKYALELINKSLQNNRDPVYVASQEANISLINFQIETLNRQLKKNSRAINETEQEIISLKEFIAQFEELLD